MIYEWDPKKAEENLKRHKVSFDEATSVSNKQRILFLSHADRGEDHVRIISARLATPTEAHGYQESRK